MHASYQIINQVLQLAYTTQACVSNLKTYAMQASTWLCTYQIQPIKVHELVPPTCVLLLSKNFDPSLLFNVAPSLSMSMSNIYFFVSISPKAFISLYNLSPFVINFHKRCASLDTKGGTRDRWLTLESSIFYGHHFICWNDTICIVLEIPHIESLTLIPIGGTPPPMSQHGSSIC